MKIGITGASGHLGSATVRELESRIDAKDIVAISRAPEKIASLGVETRAGDFDKPKTLAAAFRGLDKVLMRLEPLHHLEDGDHRVHARSRQ